MAGGLRRLHAHKLLEDIVGWTAVPTGAILNDLRSIFRLPAKKDGKGWQRSRRRRRCVSIDKQLKMKCNSEGKCKRKLLLASRSHESCDCLRQTILRIKCVHSLTCPSICLSILEIRFYGFLFRLTMRWFSIAFALARRSPHFPPVIILIITFARDAGPSRRGPCALSFFFISQCGKLFVFHSPVPLPFVLVLCGPSLIFDFMKYLCLALVSREIDFSYHLFGAPKNPITQAPNHPITHSPFHFACHVHVLRQPVEKQLQLRPASKKDHAPASSVQNRCWHVSRQRINKYFIICINTTFH